MFILAGRYAVLMTCEKTVPLPSKGFRHSGPCPPPSGGGGRFRIVYTIRITCYTYFSNRLVADRHDARYADRRAFGMTFSMTIGIYSYSVWYGERYGM